MLRMYSIYDEKSCSYGVPFFATNDGVALRNFGMLCNDVNSTVYNYPSDFTLYRLGAFDDNVGDVCIEEKPVYVAKASALMKPNNDDIEY